MRLFLSSITRRGFLGMGAVAAAAIAGLSLGINHLRSSKTGQRTLYVAFTNPRPGASIAVPVPFSGHYAGVESQAPSGVAYTLQSNGHALTSGLHLAEQDVINVTIKTCPTNLAECQISLTVQEANASP